MDEEYEHSKINRLIRPTTTTLDHDVLLNHRPFRNRAVAYRNIYIPPTANLILDWTVCLLLPFAVHYTMFMITKICRYFSRFCDFSQVEYLRQWGIRPTIVSVEVNISIEIDRKINVTVILFLLVQSRHQTHVWTLIGSGADGLGIQVWGGQEYWVYTIQLLL